MNQNVPTTLARILQGEMCVEDVMNTSDETKADVKDMLCTGIVPALQSFEYTDDAAEHLISFFESLKYDHEMLAIALRPIFASKNKEELSEKCTTALSESDRFDKLMQPIFIASGVNDLVDEVKAEIEAEENE